MRTVPRRILIVRPSAFGDVCRTIPVAWSLRNSFPQAVIDWVVEDRWAPALSAHPAIDHLIEFPKERFRAFWRNPAVAMETLRWFGRLREGRYDLVIDAQGLARSGLMSIVSGAPDRVGLATAREFAWLGTNQRVRVAPGTHTVDAMLQLVERAGAQPVRDMRLVTPQGDLANWQQMRSLTGITGQYVVAATANKWAGKRWSASRWQECMSALDAEFHDRGINSVVWLGGPGEQEQVAQNLTGISQQRLRHVDLSGHTSVGETMAVIQGASLAISLDSAPAHIAVGLGVGVVSLYGATRPQTDGPYGQGQWCIHGGAGEVLGSHDYRDADKGARMMQRITVQAVVERVIARLAEGSSR